MRMEDPSSHHQATPSTSLTVADLEEGRQGF